MIDAWILSVARASLAGLELAGFAAI